MESAAGDDIFSVDEDLSQRKRKTKGSSPTERNKMSKSEGAFKCDLTPVKKAPFQKERRNSFSCHRAEPKRLKRCLSADIERRLDSDDGRPLKLPAVCEESQNDSQNVVIRLSPSQCAADDVHLDSTISIGADSPSEAGSHVKIESNGYHSSTPAVLGLDKLARFKVTSSNSSISPIGNGHSDADSLVRPSSRPAFDVQINCDDRDGFLSLVVVKTDSDVGVDLSREIQKLSKRIGSEQYGADVSKTDSSSSVTSGGPLRFPPKRPTSFATSSSSNGSSRTHDGAFVVPRRRDKSACVQKSRFVVDDVRVLKAKVDDVLDRLVELYGDESGNGPSTPKSTKKKLPAKTRRGPGGGKAKKGADEFHLNGEIHSPEMMATDRSACARPSTPIEDAAKGPGTLVLAKWVDKKYYSAVVKKHLDGGRYVVEFYDGQVKTLLDDFIIFGTAKRLPILNQSIYAIVDDKNRYEAGIVLSLIEEDDGTIAYRCATDGHQENVSVKTSDIYVTEDQAKSIRESCNLKSPQTPSAQRRRANRELDLDNIIHGPRSARLKNRDSSAVPRSPEASTSGLAQRRRSRKTVPPKRRQESESSEGGDGASSRAPSSVALEEVSGTQPEIQKTPRKIEGAKVADAFLIKGTSKQNSGKRCSKVTKFENDLDTNGRLGPIPPAGSALFKGLHFLLTCTDPPRRAAENRCKDGSCSDSESQVSEREDRSFTDVPYQKDRLKEQLEAGGGVVYGHFEDVPKDKYDDCKLIAPRPCLTAKYVQCLAANIKALSHVWVVRSCQRGERVNMEEDELPAGWSLEMERYVRWRKSTEDRLNETPFKEYTILLCGDNDTFVKFWRRVCTLAGAETRTIGDDLDLEGGLVVVTESDCHHEVQNAAVHFNVPLVSTHWVVQCLITGTICDNTARDEYNFAYNDTY